MEQSPQEQPVQTGLVTEPQSAPISPDAAEAPAPPSPPISISLPPDVTTKVGEVNQVEQLAKAALAKRETPEQNFSRETQEQAEADNLRRDFQQKMAARNEPPPVYRPPPVPERIAEQTRLEMEAGRKRVAEHAAAQALNPRAVAIDPREGKSVAILRPGDFVPDPKKGQGLVASASSTQAPL